jgi:hypothetical protein
MRITSGKVVGGRIEPKCNLPEGSSVTILAHDSDETFEVDAATEKVLLDAIAQCQRGDTVSMSELLPELRRRSPDEVTEAMNRVCAEVGHQQDAFVAAAARRVLEQTE